MHTSNRLLGVLAIAVLVAGAIGFVIEIDPDRYELKGFQMPAESNAAVAIDPARPAEPARSYDELARRPWRSGAQTSWEVDGPALARAFARALPPDGAEHVQTSDALADRAAWRAYEGAPPMIPHPVASSGAAECMACHGAGIRLGRLVARKLPHAAYASCTQCHVSDASAPPFAARARTNEATPLELAADGSPQTLSQDSDFAGLRPVQLGPRAWPGAPPAIPHTTQMRSECLSCHGPGAREGMRSSHPERTSCLQCHATSATLDQRANDSVQTDGPPLPLWVAPRPAAEATPR